MYWLEKNASPHFKKVPINNFDTKEFINNIYYVFYSFTNLCRILFEWMCWTAMVICTNHCWGEITEEKKD